MKAKPQPIKELKSIAECEDTMHRLLLDIVKRESLEACRDKDVALATAMYQPGIELLTRHQQELELQLQQYYMTHSAEIEQDGKKSLQLTNGVIGLRLSPPALKPLSKAWTWDAVMARLHHIFGSQFERVKTELDKDAIKANIPAGELGNFGLKLSQEETFYAEPLRPHKPES